MTRQWEENGKINRIGRNCCSVFHDTELVLSKTLVSTIKAIIKHIVIMRVSYIIAASLYWRMQFESR